ncbi:MAG: ABC transporter ATP-binding protein [bacterium]|nr:ABC transporter ATP-binding protein [bacterium]
MNNIRLFTRILKPFRRTVIVLAILILGSAFFESIGMAMLVPLFESILGQEGDSQLSRILNPTLRLIGAEGSVIGMAILVLALFVIKNTLLVNMEGMSSRFVYSIREYWMKKIHDYYFKMPYGQLIQYKQGFLTDSLITETNKAASGLINLAEFVIGTVMVVVFFVLLLAAHLEITFVLTIIGGALYFLVIKTFKRYAMSMGEKEIFFQQELQIEATENIAAMRQIRTFSIEEYIGSRFKEKLGQLTKLMIRWEWIRAIPKPSAETMIVTVFVGVVMLMYVRSPEELKGLVPTLGLIAIVAQRLFTRLSHLVVNRMVVIRFIPVFQLVQNLVENGESIHHLAQVGQPFNRLDSDIEFRGVSFNYAEKSELFKDINFTLPKGNITAIVGSSGSGKSTIADLMLGLYGPTSGAILINSRPLSSFDTHSWRQGIGFVSQENFLFHSSIMENLKIGNLNATDEEVMAACKRANAHEFIMQFPERYKTIVGDRGVMLSGGQRQRIAIARALVRDPEILIFDEATSALDYETEREIQKEIFEIAKGKTVLIISHRLETIKDADKILKIENGAVKEIHKSKLALHNS